MVSVFLLGSKVNSGHHMPPRWSMKFRTDLLSLNEQNTEMVFVHGQQAAQDGYL